MDTELLPLNSGYEELKDVSFILFTAVVPHAV
jgi:hypothetical protein